MSNNGLEGKKDNQNESLWVWIKPASFYNLLETRYNQNVILATFLSFTIYSEIPSSEKSKLCIQTISTRFEQVSSAALDTGVTGFCRAEGNLEVEFLDLSRNMSCANPKQKTRHMRLTVIAVVCEKLSDRVTRRS